MKKQSLLSILILLISISNSLTTSNLAASKLVNPEEFKQRLLESSNCLTQPNLTTSRLINPKELKKRLLALEKPIKEEIKEIYEHTDPNEQKVIKNYLKYLKEDFNNKNLDSKTRLSVKETFLNAIQNLTSISAIKCATLITALYQIKTILISDSLVDMVEQLTKTGRVLSWNGGIIAIVVFLLKRFK